MVTPYYTTTYNYDNKGSREVIYDKLIKIITLIRKWMKRKRIYQEHKSYINWLCTVVSPSTNIHLSNRYITNTPYNAIWLVNIIKTKKQSNTTQTFSTSDFAYITLMYHDLRSYPPQIKDTKGSIRSAEVRGATSWPWWLRWSNVGRYAAARFWLHSLCKLRDHRL